MAVHILGIRHHGVGSAKHVLRRLEELQPDLIMIEGAPDIDSVLKYVGHEELVPPVAIMAYEKGVPQASTFYPFGEYSPEWVAAKYANANGTPIRALDLPIKFSFQMSRDQKAAEKEEDFQMPRLSRDPISYLAEAAGYSGSDSWWDDFFEQRVQAQSGADYFDAVMLAMSALREEGIQSHLDRENVFREAYMRHLIRQAETEMYSNIAVICGAWHGPSLVDAKSKIKEDKKILKDLPKSRLKIITTWIPWTNERLSMASGYGAGISSPGWYEHQWQNDQDTEITWLTKVAEIFRAKKIDVSTAHVIEAFHLSQTLAALRSHSNVNLAELDEATIAVMCLGDRVKLEMIRKELTVGDRIGQVPEDVPKVPLQEDFERQVKSLRIRLTAEEKQVDLDLRKENHLMKSILFHRLAILEIPWAQPTVTRSKGTFKESWVTEWNPGMMIGLIDKAYLGNTIHAATETTLRKQCDETKQISEIAAMLNLALPAEMVSIVGYLLSRINDLTSVSADIQDLMKSLPQLIDASRYGSVRKHDAQVLVAITEQLFTKICIGLPNACYGIDEDSSNILFDLISTVNESIRLLENAEATERWLTTLAVLVHKEGIHHIIRGCTTRLLLDAERFTTTEASIILGRELSQANDPHDVASWIEGFLRGSGMILIYDHRLWNLLYQWVKGLDDEIFKDLLPYLRRAFSKFDYGERRQIGDKAKYGIVDESFVQQQVEEDLDQERVDKITPTLEYLMGG